MFTNHSLLLALLQPMTMELPPTKASGSQPLPEIYGGVRLGSQRIIVEMSAWNPPEVLNPRLQYSGANL